MNLTEACFGDVFSENSDCCQILHHGSRLMQMNLSLEPELNMGNYLRILLISLDPMRRN